MADYPRSIRPVHQARLAGLDTYGDAYREPAYGEAGVYDDDDGYDGNYPSGYGGGASRLAAATHDSYGYEDNGNGYER